MQGSNMQQPSNCIGMDPAVRRKVHQVELLLLCGFTTWMALRSPIGPTVYTSIQFYTHEIQRTPEGQQDASSILQRLTSPPNKTWCCCPYNLCTCSFSYNHFRMPTTKEQDPSCRSTFYHAKDFNQNIPKRQRQISVFQHVSTTEDMRNGPSTIDTTLCNVVFLWFKNIDI